MKSRATKSLPGLKSFASRPQELNAQPKYPAVQCSGSTRGCSLSYSQSEAVRTHKFARSFIVLQEPGRVPFSLLVSRAL